uniref:Uncharacterized protein n=1 Tax=Timema bartmani TaxID=61472 RepID=A0A7R9ESA4_9NEOP|nr:unnamed protein product [Timema bartmani]
MSGALANYATKADSREEHLFLASIPSLFSKKKMMFKETLVGSVPSFSWRESGKPFKKIYSQCTRPRSNLNLHVFGSLVCRESTALNHAAAEAGAIQHSPITSGCLSRVFLKFPVTPSPHTFPQNVRRPKIKSCTGRMKSELWHYVCQICPGVASRVRVYVLVRGIEEVLSEVSQPDYSTTSQKLSVAKSVAKKGIIEYVCWGDTAMPKVPGFITM